MSSLSHALGVPVNPRANINSAPPSVNVINKLAPGKGALKFKKKLSISKAKVPKKAPKGYSLFDTDGDGD